MTDIDKPRPWAECRRAWGESESRRLLNLKQQRDAWADGRCGQCGRHYLDHPEPSSLTPVSTADAVLLQPCPPEECARILGNLPPLSAELVLSLERLHTAAVQALTATAVLDPDSALLPAEVAR